MAFTENIYIYNSTDTSAPVLSGSPGTLINVLTACLVNGYGSKTAMGWTLAYSGTNLAAYKMPSGTSQMYLAVDDTSVAGTPVVRVNGFGSMNGIWASVYTQAQMQQLTTNPQQQQFFPNYTQMNVGSGGEYIYKTATNAATARAQTLISNGRLFYLWMDSAGDGVNTRVFAFGDIASYVTNDANPCILIGQGASTGYNPFVLLGTQSGNLTGHYLASRYDGLSQSMAASKFAMNGAAFQTSTVAQSMGGLGYNLLYPDPIVGGMQLTPVGVCEFYYSLPVYRGRLSGLQAPIHSQPFQTGDTISGQAGTPLAGKTFQAFRTGYYNAGTAGCFLIETSNTQDAVNFK